MTERNQPGRDVASEVVYYGVVTVSHLSQEFLVSREDIIAYIDKRPDLVLAGDRVYAIAT